MCPILKMTTKLKICSNLACACTDGPTVDNQKHWRKHKWPNEMMNEDSRLEVADAFYV